jgi:hypothetical protein
MIKIIIGDRVLNQIHRSVFIVEINQMSGDADSYEIAKFTFKSKATTDLVNFVTLAKQIQLAQSNGYNNTHNTVKGFLGDDAPVDEDLIGSICGYDIFNDDFLSTVEDVKVFWYDEEGIQYYCDVYEVH